MVTVLGLIVTKNEADRYLRSVIRHLLVNVVDDLFIYDDQSTDDTREVAADYGVDVVCRTGRTPSFLEDESRFRQAAWEQLGEHMNPTAETWILSVDADEYPVAPHGAQERTVLDEVAITAQERSYGAVSFPVAEVFDLVDDRPMVRADGYWGTITAARFAQWTGDCSFQWAHLAGGSLPLSAGPPMRVDGAISFLHVGYAHPEDRMAKYERYTADRGAHSSRHVASIVAPPTLVPWVGSVPKIWRGVHAGV